MDIKSVGVIGAGQMGNGIAHVLALAEYDVMLTDVSQDALDSALVTSSRLIWRVRPVAGKISDDQLHAALKPISTTLALPELGQTDLVIEAATEREAIKQAIFEDLQPHLLPHTILTSNTSSISITRLASRTDRPERFHGVPFHEPGAGDATG